MSQADLIRQTVIDKYIAPARAAGQTSVTIRAGDIHNEMGLTSAMPAVCSALRAAKFEQLAGVMLVEVTGPHNGANVYFQFDLNGRTHAPSMSPRLRRDDSVTVEPARQWVDAKVEEGGTSAAGRSPLLAGRPSETFPSPGTFVAGRKPDGPEERHYTIGDGDTGHSYDTIFGPYLPGARSLVVEDPYIRSPHQIANFVRFCETVVQAHTIRSITLVTSSDLRTDMAVRMEKLDELKQSLLKYDVELEVRLKERIHDREVHLDNGWTIKVGRGLDLFYKPEGWSAVGTTNLSLRRCRETKVDVYRSRPAQD